jgi:hypothetical protein
LRHGGLLYVGKLDKEAPDRIDEVENFLIHEYGSEMNTRIEAPMRSIVIIHAGEIPASIRNAMGK